MRAPPPRDQNGKIVPHDHPDILAAHFVIRHITPNDLHVVSELENRISSGAYSESAGGGMSVDIEDWMAADGIPSLHYITDPSHGAVKLNVGQLRNLGFLVGWDPDGGHEYHGAVWGIGNGSKRRRKIAAIAIIVTKASGQS